MMSSPGNHLLATVGATIKFFDVAAFTLITTQPFLMIPHHASEVSLFICGKNILLSALIFAHITSPNILHRLSNVPLLNHPLFCLLAIVKSFS